MILVHIFSSMPTMVAGMSMSHISIKFAWITRMAEGISLPIISLRGASGRDRILTWDHAPIVPGGVPDNGGMKWLALGNLVHMWGGERCYSYSHI